MQGTIFLLKYLTLILYLYYNFLVFEPDCNQPEVIFKLYQSPYTVLTIRD